MPQVSVIVPVYKVEKYVYRCIDSILNQTFTDFELILVDDGSLDNCSEICDEYAIKDCRVQVIHKENGGVSSARNIGLDACCCEYVTFIDSDDYVCENWLETLYNAIIKDASDLVSSGIQYVDENGIFINILDCERGNFILDDQNKRLDFIISHVLNGKFGWSVWKSLFRLNIIKQNHICFCLDCENYAEDLCFTIEYLLYSTKVKSCDLFGYYYVRHDGSMMSNSTSVLKFNAMNEVSKQFGIRYFSCYSGLHYKKIYSVIHYLIMNKEYYRVASGNQFYPEACKIKDREWYKKQTYMAFVSRNEFVYYLGMKYAREAFFTSVFCLFRIWEVYSVLSTIKHHAMRL